MTMPACSKMPVRQLARRDGPLKMEALLTEHSDRKRKHVPIVPVSVPVYETSRESQRVLTLTSEGKMTERSAKHARPCVDRESYNVCVCRNSRIQWRLPLRP